MSEKTTPFAVACKSCGYIEDKAWQPETDTTHSFRLDGTTKVVNGQKQTVENVPLTERGRVPMYCPKCGSRNWEVPASKERLAAHEVKQRRELRAAELTGGDNFDGLFKIPDNFRGPAELKRALSNLLGPLDGEVLKNAQANVMKVQHSGLQGDTLALIDFYDQAVQKAVNTKATAKA